MSIQQWPVHQQRMYRQVKASNSRKRAKFTEEQHEQFWGMTTTAAVKCSDYLSSTDYPDELAEVMTDQYIISLVK